RLIELRLVGAKVEHFDRFSLTGPDLTMTWRGNAATVAVRAARSEIVGRQGSRLVYHTGLYFVGLNSITRGFISSILEGDRSNANVVATPNMSQRSQPVEEPETRGPDDTWTR